MSRVLEKFPKEAVCPICNLSDEYQYILLPVIERALRRDGLLYEAQPFHLDCVLKRLSYYKENGAIAGRVD
jgi:hypothetical protein